MLAIKELFHSINIKRKAYFSEILEAYDLNLMEVEILAFLQEQPESNTFTQIMKSKDYAKSHISTTINHLVASGYLEKKGASNNKKVYHLCLLEKSDGVIKDYYHCIQTFQRDAFLGIPAEELQVFQQVIEQMNKNLSQD